MDMAYKEKFLDLWQRYFPGAELPITVSYADGIGELEKNSPPSGHQCLIGVLSRVRKGKSVAFDAESMGCFGGKRYLGFRTELSSSFEYFLSSGIPGELEGERYKKTPELVRELMQYWPTFEAPAEYAIFKRWDNLAKEDQPQVAVFFAPPQVLSGLFTLANFDIPDPNGVFCPFCAGCASIVMYPYLEREAERPRAVLGMFDVSARPYVPRETLTFAVPMNKLQQMTANMEESFLTTHSWEKVKKRLGTEN